MIWKAVEKRSEVRASSEMRRTRSTSEGGTLAVRHHRCFCLLLIWYAEGLEEEQNRIYK
jgi:hypothetical protein